GIGRALCRRFAKEGLAGLVVADVDPAGAEAVASECGGVAAHCDAAVERDVRALFDVYGRVDVFCSNAGIFVEGGVDVADAAWDRIWRVNVMAHIFAARAMVERGGGYLLQTVSAAGLLTQIGSAPYAVTKHAALALAEWLAVTHGDAGLKVSCLCPQGVRTRMLGERPNFLTAGAIEPEAVAEAAVAGLDAERFLILPHPDVAEYFRRKASDYERWLRGMRRLRDTMVGHDQPGE
ncbi:MAG: SDR family oxidoreductase, partial [Bryobacteraceae bacterium]